ncbi:MAG: helix-turn-helix transcriptional regulator [Opitutales bacterium]|nr:helix-turn-helix transcriptional regulator [Opitutales bacterium]
MEDDLDNIRARTADTHLLERRAHEALHRWLTIAADDLAESIDLRLDYREKPLPAAVSKVCAWISREFQGVIRLSEAARLSGLSEGHFSRLFHESTGLRFIEYVNETRLDEARRLLGQSALPVTEVAFASGFQSLSQFNRLFRRSTGKTPLEWRRAQSAVAV